MKRIKFLLGVTILFSSSYSFSTNRDSVNAVISVNAPAFLEVDTLHKANEFDIEVYVFSPMSTDSIKDVVVKLSAETVDYDNKYLTLSNNRIFVSKAELKADTVVKLNIKCEVKVDSTFKLNENKVFLVKVSNFGSNEKIKIETDALIIRAVLSFRTAGGIDGVNFALGANFDLADKVKLNSFYGRLSYFNPVVKDLGEKWFKSIGIYGGIYQNKYVSNETTEPENEYFKVLSIRNDDTLTINRISATRTVKTSYNNYGLLISIPFTFFKSDENQNKKVYLAATFFDFEGVLRKTTDSYTYTTSLSDTFNIKKSDFVQSNTLIDSKTEDHYDKYWGAATLQYSHSRANYKIFIKGALWGLYWQDDIKATHSFYSCYFGITERKFGIRIGGEIKGVYGQPNPFFNLFLTKAFDLAKLGEGLKVD